MKQACLVFTGAAVGGAVGYFLFFWVVSQGFYGLILPGALLGLGAGYPTSRSIVPAVVCGVLAVAVGLFTEWRFAPFKQDDSLSFFLLHVHHLSPVTLLMIAAGGWIGFWVPFRRVSPTVRPSQPAA
jgi:hypothetical protein